MNELYLGGTQLPDIAPIMPISGILDSCRRAGVTLRANTRVSEDKERNRSIRAFLDERSDHQPLRRGNIPGQGYFH